MATVCHYALSLEGDSDSFISSPRIWSASIANLATEYTHVELAQCSIPAVESRNWTAWMANYKPPQCPSTTASMTKLTADGRDEVLIGDSTVHFNIRPRSANEQAKRGATGAQARQNATSSKPSIAIVFLDAVSRASFFRSFESSAATVKAMMAKGEAFTFGGLASSDRYTPPNAAMVLGGIACSDGVLSGFVYQSVCKTLARNAPGDVALWEIAREHGMITSASIDDWDELDFLHRGKWDHEFHAKEGASVQQHQTDYGRLRCFGGKEVSGAQLSHTRAVHEAYDEEGSRVLSFTYIMSTHQSDTRHG